MHTPTYEQELLFGSDSKSTIKRKALTKLMLAEKIPTDTIANIAGVSERQVYNYQAEIRQLDQSKLYEDQHFRPESDLQAYEKEILQDLTGHPVATVLQAAKRIEDKTGIKRSTVQVRKFIRRGGLKPRKTAALPAKLDTVEQRAFFENELTPRLELAKVSYGAATSAIVAMIEPDAPASPIPISEPDVPASPMPIPISEPDVPASSMPIPISEPDVPISSMPIPTSEPPGSSKNEGEGHTQRAVLFMDASHFIWQAYLGVLWCLERIIVPAASGRQRINVLGAYDAYSNTLLKIINRTYITSATICEMLQKIRDTYIGQMVTVVLDNARYQHCILVIDKAKKLGIELLFLPTYSPNLNLIERLWKFVKKNLRSDFYETANAFEEAVLKCLDEVATVKAKEVKSLMATNFHLYDKYDELPDDWGKKRKKSA
jgi:transposase